MIKRRKKYKFIFSSVVVLAAMSATGCSSLFEKESKARLEGNVEVTDRARYEKALALANQANREVLRNNYPRALQLANTSLSTHENFDAYYIKGTILHRLKRYEESLKSYLQAESIKPDNPQLLLSLGVLYTNRGEPEAALARYKELHRRNPGDPLYAYKMGTTYKLMRKFDEAYEALQLADKEGFEDLDQVYLQLSDTALELRKYEKSEEYLQKAKNLNPDLKTGQNGAGDARVARLLEKGNGALEEKKYQEAIDYFKEAEKLAPESAGPRLLHGSVSIILEDYENAIQTLSKAVELNPENPRGYALLGSAYERKGDLISAEKVVKTGIKIAPENAELHNTLGVVYRSMGEMDRAIDSFYQAVQLREKYVSANVNLSYAYMNDGRYMDAERQMKKTLEYHPGNEQIERGLELLEVYRMIERGDRQLSEGKIDKAIAIYKMALEKNDSLPITRNALGNAYLEKKKYREAEEHYQKSLKHDPKNVPALQGMVRLYAATGNARARRATMSRLNEVTGQNVYAVITVGRLLEDEGKLEKARDYYEAELKKHKESQAILGRLGYVHYKIGLKQNEDEQYEKALESFQRANKYNPEIPLLDETISIVQQNIRFRSLIPELKEAEALFDREEYEKALPEFEKIYEKMKRPLVLVRIAECHMNLGREDRGLEILEKARIDSPEDVEIAEAIFTFFLKKGELNRAKNGFQDIISRNEAAYFSHYKLGVIHLKQKNEDDAIEAFTRSLIYRPDFIMANIARGVAYYEDGDETQARQEFEEAMKKDESSPLPHYNIGVMLFNDDLLDQAEKIFQDLAKKDPDFTDARYQLSFIHFKRNELERAEEEMRKLIEVKKDVKYYTALTRILEKQYENGNNPAVLNKLKVAYQTVVTEFPSTRASADARTRLATISPNARILQPYPISRSAAKTPILSGGDLVYVDETRIHAMDSAAKEIRWTHRAQAPVRDLLIHYAIHALLPGKVRLIDSTEGETIGEFPVESDSVKLIGEFDRVGVVHQVKKGRSIERGLKLYNAKGELIASTNTAPDSDYLYNGKKFYRIQKVTGGFQLERFSEKDLTLEKKSEEVIAVTGNGEVKLYSSGESVFLFYPGQSIAVVDGDDLDLEQKLEVHPKANRAIEWKDKEGNRGLMIPESNALIVMNEDGDVLEKISLEVPIFGTGSVFTQDGNNFLVVGRDRKLRMIDRRGKVLWTMDLPEAASTSDSVKAAYTLYY